MLVYFSEEPLHDQVCWLGEWMDSLCWTVECVTPCAHGNSRALLRSHALLPLAGQGHDFSANSCCLSYSTISSAIRLYIPNPTQNTPLPDLIKYPTLPKPHPIPWPPPTQKQSNAVAEPFKTFFFLHKDIKDKLFHLHHCKVHRNKGRNVNSSKCCVWFHTICCIHIEGVGFVGVGVWLGQSLILDIMSGITFIPSYYTPDMKSN